MILLDKPYVSDFLRDTLTENNIPVVATSTAKALLNGAPVNFISETTAIDTVASKSSTMLYTNSENAVDWIEENLIDSHFARNNKLFKNKLAFRDLLKESMPNYFYRGVKLDELDSLNISTLPMPFIIKPAVGFFSLGVSKVERPEDWEQTKAKLKEKIAQVKAIYPTAVLDANDLIVEEVLEGEEFAVDAYYNDQGKPVVLFIMQHRFASDGDVGDRIYFTSKQVIKKNLPLVTPFLEDLGKRANIKNYPVHVEVRIDEHNNVNPIEVNPMRFGGWCTSAELAKHAFDLNTYQHLFAKSEPNWEEILANKNESLTSIVILDNAAGHDYKNPYSFDYDQLLSDFEKPLEIRKVDYTKFHIFGFLYCETRPDHTHELDKILSSDLKEYMKQ